MTVVIRDAGASTVVIHDNLASVVIQPAMQVVLRSGEAQGPSGPPGSAGALHMGYQSDTTMSGHRVVKMEANGKVGYADSANVPDAGQVLGVTLNAALPGDVVNVQVTGELTESSWTWVPGGPVYLGTAGTLTQMLPVAGFQLVVGIAVAPDKLVIGIKQAIIL